MLNEKNFREAFEPLHASDQTVKEVLKMTQKQEKRSPHRVLRTAMVAAMTLVLIAGIVMTMPFTGSAAPEEPRPIYENSEAILVTLYGEDYDREAAARYVEPYIYPIEGTLTYQGYTIELEAAAFDAITGSGLLYYSLEIPEGTKDYWEIANDMLVVNTTGEYRERYPEPRLNHAFNWFLDQANSTETKLYIVSTFLYLEELFTDVEGLNKQAIENGIRDKIEDWLAFYTNDVLKIRFVVPGAGGGESRYMKILVDPMGGMEWISLDGGNMHLSPLGIQLAEDPYHFDLRDPYDENRVWEDCFQILDMRIHYADGTEFVVERKEWFHDEEREGLYTVVHNKLDGLLSYKGANNMYYSSIFFNEIIDVENVVSIELNGTHYYVDDLNEPYNTAAPGFCSPGRLFAHYICHYEARRVVAISGTVLRKGYRWLTLK